MSLLHGEILIAGAEVTVKPLDADLKGSKLFTVLEGIAHKQGIAWAQLKVGSNVEVMVVCGLLLLKDILGTAISKVTTVGPGIKIQNGLYSRGQPRLLEAHRSADHSHRRRAKSPPAHHRWEPY